MKKIIILLIINSTFLLFKCAYSQEWKTQNSGTYAPLLSVYCTDSNTCYAVGFGGTILKTTDGGNKWIEQNNDITEIFQSVFFTDSNTGYAADLDLNQVGLILKTTNAGNNWIKYDSASPQILHSIFFPTKNIGFAVGLNGIIINTTNGGANWVLQSYNLDTLNYLFSVYFTNKDTGFAVGEDNWGYGAIVKTTNGGKNWVLQDSIVQGQLTSVFFPKPETGYIISEGYPGYILKTENGGKSWINIYGYNDVTCFFNDVNSGYQVGGDGTIYKTTDGGYIWKQQISSTSNYLYSVFFPDSNTGYAVGGNGTILKYTNPTDVINKLIMDNGKWKIYPNPTFNNLNIEYNTTNKIFRNSTFLIYNLQGEQVYIQEINKTISEINLNNLNKGVYIIKIQNSTDLTISKIIKL